MIMDANARALVQRLITAVAPLIKNGWTQLERDTPDEQRHPISTTFGALRSNAQLVAEANAALAAATAP